MQRRVHVHYVHVCVDFYIINLNLTYERGLNLSSVLMKLTKGVENCPVEHLGGMLS